MFSGLFFFFFKQKTAYEMRISDWSSDVCSSDLAGASLEDAFPDTDAIDRNVLVGGPTPAEAEAEAQSYPATVPAFYGREVVEETPEDQAIAERSEEHTSELQSLMSNSYAVFCLKKQKNTTLHSSHYCTNHKPSHH